MPLPSSPLTPLSGLRVLEFTHAVLGPMCGLMLADFGAEVIRVEPPTGDPTRTLKGFGMGYYPFFNRNKKSLAVDLKTEHGRAIIQKLLTTTDILIENFGPGTMDRLGLGYDALATNHSSLIYASLKGFMPGPYEHRAALDEVVQMMSGLAYMTGPPGQPLRAGASIIDIMGGMYGAFGVLLALKERETTGRGQLVRGALFETAAFVMGHHMAYSAMSGEPVPPMPARVSAWAVYHQFETADGARVFIGVTSDAQWGRFCEAFEKEVWRADERLTTNNARIDAREWLLPMIREMIGGMTQADVLERCERAGVPFSPIARPEDLFDDLQLIGGGSLLETLLPNGMTVPLPRQPLALDGRVGAVRLPPPGLGAHTQEILIGLGFELAEIEGWLAQGIVARMRD
ncbi:MAG: CoA transferase [Anaerolineales bacterium]|nr:CoA transferase [Anaerolineales bacterium]